MLHLSFLLKSVSAMYNFRSADDQNLIKTNTRKVSVQKFEIWHEDNFTTFCSWTFFNSHWLHVYDRPDIYWSDLNTILTVEKKINFWKYFSWYFFNCHIVSWRSSAVHKMAKTKSALDKLVRFLKVESIYNYPILWEYNSINRWRYWKTRDLGVWH